MNGKLIECPKHNGRFNLPDGSPARAPVCRGLLTYPIEERNGRIWLNITHAGGDGSRAEKTYTFEVVSNPEAGRRNNYSLASNPQNEETLRFNVRIATPPPGQDCPPGIGSSYVFNLKPGDTVTAIGPFGDFHIKPTRKEMVYIGGGAGMAPLRAHIAHLFENEHTARKVSFWYGARSKQEIYYREYFEDLSRNHGNFSFNLALSEPLPEDNWNGYNGFIHEVVLDNYLQNHPNPSAIEFYLCGPPMMIKACTKMLRNLGVDPQQIAYDEF